MVKPWEVSSDDIVRWADSAQAPSILPKLIRRLLLQTATIIEIDIAGDTGVSQGGWDGWVRSSEGTAFWPDGWSGWEMSVRRDKSKLNEDFDKRASETSSAVPQTQITYVAVSARRVTSKSNWAADKKRQGIWKDVRVLDAEDLATWLESAPSVAAWFAKHALERPVDEITEGQTFLEDWCNRTQPPLPNDLVLTNRQQESQQLLDWLGHAPSPPLYIAGDRHDEAIVFVVATLAQSELHSS